MKKLTAAAILAGIAGAVLLMWVPAKWAGNVFDLLGFFLAALWLAAWCGGWVPLRVTPALLPLAAMAAWPLLQIAWGVSFYPWKTGVSALFWIANLAWFFVALQALDDSRLLGRFVRGLIVFGFLLAVLSPLQLFTANGRIFWLFPVRGASYVLGPFLYSNQYSAFMEMLLPLALYAAVLDPRWRTFHCLAAATMFTSVIASASRAGFALAALELLGVPLLLLCRRRAPAAQIGTVGIICGGMIAALGIAIGPTTVFEKFTARDPFSVRREFLRSTVEMIADHPAAGVGLGNWATAYPAYAYFDDGLYANQAHNDWAQWAAEGGLPFFALAVWLAALGVRSSIESVWGLGIVAVFLHSLLDYPIERTAMAITFFTLLAAVIACRDPLTWEREEQTAINLREL